MNSVIRRATIADIATIAHHRVSMFLDMGSATADVVNALAAATEEYLRGAIPSGEYSGWLACAEEDPARVVAGAGAQLGRTLPFPRQKAGGDSDVAHGRHAIVVNVYTEPRHRRRGFARALMNEVLKWAQEANVESLVLHAAPDGRPLYEELGFAPTNELRYMNGL